MSEQMETEADRTAGVWNRTVPYRLGVEWVGGSLSLSRDDVPAED